MINRNPSAPSPAEIHRQLIEIEKAKDQTRFNPSPPKIKPNLGRARLQYRRTVVLSTADLLRMMHQMTPGQTPSEWIRNAILMELERLERKETK